MRDPSSGADNANDRVQPASPDPCQIVSLSQPGEASAGSIIYVHGFGSSAEQAWSAGPGRDLADSWPGWAAAEWPTASVFAVDYPAGATVLGWRPAMAIADRARNMMAELNRVLAVDGPVIFVCHSLGGLVVKQLLRHAADLRQSPSLASRTKGIIFLGTPHSGSWIAAMAAWLPLGTLLTAPVGEMRSHSPYLRDLNQWFRGYCRDSGPEVHVFAEQRRRQVVWRFGVTVCDPTTSDPGIADVTPVPLDFDHSALAKLSSTDDVRHKALRDMVTAYFRPV